MSADTVPARERLSFRRIVDVPYETCVAALSSWQHTGQGGELRFGESLVRGPVEHDRDTGTCQVQVRLTRGPLRPDLPMRLHFDRWSSSSTALELIPCRRARPTPAYFRAGHLLLDSLTHSLRDTYLQRIARDTAGQPSAASGSGPLQVPLNAGAGLPVTPSSRTGPNPIFPQPSPDAISSKDRAPE